ncbi:MAG: sulfatase-like hydrolase/transferase [Thermoplasmatota archaeon]
MELDHKKRPHIFLVILDTVRKDYAENIESRLKTDGFKVYEKVVTPAPWTIPTHTSILSGQYPSEHGAHVKGGKKAHQIKINSSTVLLSTDLKGMGYRTCLLSANPYVTKEMGYRDFDREYQCLFEPEVPFLTKEEKDELFTLRKSESSTSAMMKRLASQRRFKLLTKGIFNRFLKTPPSMFLYKKYQKYIMGWPLDKGAKRMNRKIGEWLGSKGSDTPCFMMVNYMEAHEPYFDKPILKAKLNFSDTEYRRKIDEQTIEKLRKGYRRSIDYLWNRIEEFVSILKGKGIFDDSLIIMISDHGQLFGEHDQLGHGTFLYDELTFIPLLIKYPKMANLEKYSSENEYISPVDLRKFILDGLNTGIFLEEMLYSQTVYSETHGVSQLFTPKEDEEKAKMESYERHRVAVYYNGYKGVYDVGEGKFTRLRSLNDSELDENVKEELRTRIMGLLKKAEGKKISKIVFSKKI